MGLHNSGTSMVARLLTLLGLWAGEETELSIGKTNKLKWCDAYGRVLSVHRASSCPPHPHMPLMRAGGSDLT